jgi:biofilm PGA synthesis N-glycosyltransferase PgaC
MPDVSLYIPCYNASRYIEKCLESILNQSYPIQNILIVDDGSTDNTLDLIKKYPNLQIIQHPENRGLAAARNTALHALITTFIANIDSDCIAEKDWLENLMKDFTDEKIVGVGGKLFETNQSTVPDFWRVIHMKQHWGDEKIVNSDWLFGHSAVFRKSALESINGYQEKFRTNYEDLDLSRRLREKGYTVVYEPQAVVHHLRTDTAYSVLKTRWGWTALGVHAPVTGLEIVKNIGRNFGRSLKYMTQDVKNGRFSLLGLDFALGFYSSYADLRSWLCRQSLK